MMNRIPTWLLGALLFLLSHSLFAGDEHSPVAINFGLGGSWYNPETDGQGFVFDVVPREDQPDLLVVYWFTYAHDADGIEGQRWLLAEGEFERGDDSVALDVYQFIGGQFDRPGEVNSRAAGAAALTFDSCASARLDYDVDLDGTESSVGGSIELERLTPDQLCKQLPRLSVEMPAQIAPGESFEVVYRITNNSPTDLSLVTPHSCLGALQFYRGSESIRVQGDDTACLTVVTHHDLPAKGTIEQVFHLQANTGGTMNSEPLSAGGYTVKVGSEVRTIGGVPATLPVAIREFVIE